MRNTLNKAAIFCFGIPTYSCPTSVSNVKQCPSNPLEYLKDNELSYCLSWFNCHKGNLKKGKSYPAITLYFLLAGLYRDTNELQIGQPMATLALRNTLSSQ